MSTMICEICGTHRNVLSVLLWQRERHDYCAACAARVRPVPLQLSETWKRELSLRALPLVIPFYVCPCDTPLIPLMHSPCDHVDEYRALGELVEEKPRCQSCGEEFPLLVADYGCQSCGAICRPTFVPWEPRLGRALFTNSVLPYGSEEFWAKVFQNPN
jgi:hypothetical protein